MAVSNIDTNVSHYEVTDFSVCKFYPHKSDAAMSTNNLTLEMTNQDNSEGNEKFIN